MDYFTALGLQPALHLDPGELEKRYYAASRELHPDRFVRASADAQRDALERSSVLTLAYRTLKDPHARAEYLLQQRGVVSKDLPPGFLEEAFELNERVEEGGPEEREKLKDVLAGIDAHLDGLYRAWGGEEPALREIRQILNQRRYIENLVHGHV